MTSIEVHSSRSLLVKTSEVIPRQINIHAAVIHLEFDPEVDIGIIQYGGEYEDRNSNNLVELKKIRNIEISNSSLRNDHLHGMLRYICNQDRPSVPSVEINSFPIQEEEDEYMNAMNKPLIPLTWELIPLPAQGELIDMLELDSRNQITSHRTRSSTSSSSSSSPSTSSTSNSSNPSSNTISTLVLLRYADDTGLILQHPLLSNNYFGLDSEQYDIISEIEFTLRHCTLHLNQIHEQVVWPARSFINMKTREVLNTSSGDSTKITIQENIHHDVFLSINDDKIVERDKPDTEIYSFHESYSSVASTWHPLVPSIPNYCGLKNGTLEINTVEELQRHHEAAFIETKQIPFLDKILGFVVKLMMPPLMNPFMDKFKTHMAHTMTQLTHAIDADTPNDVLKVLAPILVRNLTAILTDSITAEITDKLADGISEKVGSRIVAQVQAAVDPSLHKSLVENLSNSIPKPLGDSVSKDLSWQLPALITRKVTKSVTHAIVPTLAHMISNSPEQDYWCNKCYFEKIGCRNCLNSEEANYYLTYYSAYFADYYSDYYAEYYESSIDEITNIQHDPKVDKKKKEMVDGKLNGKSPLEETGMSLTPDGIPINDNLPSERKPLDDEIEVTKFGK
jgi:hypothetical protein